MIRKNNSPILSKSRIKTGIEVGRGQKQFSKPVKKVLVRGKNYFIGLIKNLNRQSNAPNYDPKKAVIRGQKAWLAFQKSGLPVPKISKLDLRKSSKTYLHLFVEDLRKKYGKLYDCHKLGEPTFLKNFSLPKDKQIIQLIAKDLAKIHSIGFTSNNIDFWHFYKKENSWNRVIIDFDGFRKYKRDLHINSVFENVYDVSTYLGNNSKKFELFIKTYTNNCKDKEISKLILKQYKKDQFGYLDPRFADQ